MEAVDPSSVGTQGHIALRGCDTRVLHGNTTHNNSNTLSQLSTVQSFYEDTPENYYQQCRVQSGQLTLIPVKYFYYSNTLFDQPYQCQKVV